MPRHPTPARRGQARLSEPALARQGIPQPGVVDTMGPPDEGQMSDILQALRGGQIGAENLMQLLSLLMARQGARRAPQPRQLPRQAQRGGGQQQPSIAGLLGGGR